MTVPDADELEGCSAPVQNKMFWADAFQVNQ
jgi:hypothetical protein